jgi:hypothetical protein
MTRTPWQRLARLAAIAAALGPPCLSSGLRTAGAEIPDEWKPGLYWEEDQLRIRVGDPDPSVRQAVDRINAGELEAALAGIESVEGADAAQRKAELALAVAGHPDVFDPEPALKLAAEPLQAALALQPENPALLRMQNQLDLYRAVPWLGLPTDPLLLPARDLVAEGKIDDARQKIADSGDRRVLNTWCLASFFEGRDDLSVLLEDAERVLSEAGAPDLLALLKQHRDYPWASLSVQPDSLLHPRVLLGRMRAYYWWWRQMGESYRPMSKQGFFELLDEVSKVFPTHDLVRMYRGERVPWGDGFRPDPPPPGAPGWAVNQRELRARVDYIVEWWFDHRQADNGELGGGWEDDCETLRTWSVTSICCGNPKIEAGIRRLVDGIWASGELVNGYDRAFKDVEHSSEMSADTSVMLSLAYGDPIYFERFLETTRTTLQVHTAANQHGHRHYKAMKMSATEVSDAARQSADAMYCGRAMRPAAMVAWYSGIPQAASLVGEWARAWSEDTVRAGETKPAGIMPAVVCFADDGVDGPTDKWWDPALGDLYDWRPGRQDMVLGKIVGAWLAMGDEGLLAGPRAQFEILRRYQADPVPDAPAGSLDWAGTALVGETTCLVGMYRAYTGDPQFDDLLLKAGTGYARFLASGDPRDVEAAHAADLNSMRVNLPMVTSEVRGTDRVALRPMSLLGPLTGSPVSVTEPPSFAVTWRDVGPDFTALVRSSHARGLSVWLYSSAEKRIQPTARFWRLEPGDYELRIGFDADADGTVEAGYGQQVAFTYARRLDGARFYLPPRRLCLVEVTQLRERPARVGLRPDLALSPRDIVLRPQVAAGESCAGEATVHNIGAAAAADVELEVRAAPISSDGEMVHRETLAELPAPLDLRPKTATADFTWTPPSRGRYLVEAVVRSAADVPEIYSGNNRASIEVEVR